MPCVQTQCTPAPCRPALCNAHAVLFHAVHTQAGGNTRKGKGEGEVGREIRNVEGERRRGRRAKVEEERGKVEGGGKEERRK